MKVLICFILIMGIMCSVYSVALHCPNDFHEADLILSKGDNIEHGIRVNNFNGIKIKLNITIIDRFNSTTLIDEKEYILEPEEKVSLLFNVSVPENASSGKHKVEFKIESLPLENITGGFLTSIGNCKPTFKYIVEEELEKEIITEKETIINIIIKFITGLMT